MKPKTNTTIAIILIYVYSTYQPLISDNNYIYNEGTELQSDKVLNEIGFLYLKKKNYYEAEKFFLLSIIKNPSVKYYYNNLSVVYINQGRYKEAYDNLKIAIAIDPNYVKALSNLSLTCFLLFRFFESYDYYKRAKEVDELYTQNRFEKNKTIKKIESISKDNPDNSQIKSILNYLKNNEDQE